MSTSHRNLLVDLNDQEVGADLGIQPRVHDRGDDAPTKRATMNSHTCLSAVPPTMSAGPKLRAGFTEVPVSGMPIRCTTVKVRPITTPAVPALPTGPVTAKMTKTKSAVRMTSAMNAPPALKWTSEEAP
jgi:hypothetical protein